MKHLFSGPGIGGAANITPTFRICQFLLISGCWCDIIISINLYRDVRQWSYAQALKLFYIFIYVFFGHNSLSSLSGKFLCYLYSVWSFYEYRDSLTFSDFLYIYLCHSQQELRIRLFMVLWIIQYYIWNLLFYV